MSSKPSASDPPIVSSTNVQLAEKHNARWGMILFIVYLAFYGLFVYLTAFCPDTMKKPLIGGVTVAVVYGFALIGSALVLALIYMMVAKPANENDEGNAI